MPQSVSDTNKKTLQQETETEIHLLQNLRDAFVSAKQELNNDLTKLAIKNLPILEDEARPMEEEGEEVEGEHNTGRVNLSQSTINSEYEQQPSTSEQNTLQQLEPLDLDV